MGVDASEDLNETDIRVDALQAARGDQTQHDASVRPLDNRDLVKMEEFLLRQLIKYPPTPQE